jgi:hypothetical protein
MLEPSESYDRVEPMPGAPKHLLQVVKQATAAQKKVFVCNSWLQETRTI